MTNFSNLTFYYFLFGCFMVDPLAIGEQLEPSSITRTLQFMSSRIPPLYPYAQYSNTNSTKMSNMTTLSSNTPFQFYLPSSICHIFKLYYKLHRFVYYIPPLLLHGDFFFSFLLFFFLLPFSLTAYKRDEGIDFVYLPLCCMITNILQNYQSQTVHKLMKSKCFSVMETSFFCFPTFYYYQKLDCLLIEFLTVFSMPKDR